MKGFLFIWLLLVCLFQCGSQAISAQYRLDHWTADDGLPQNSVRGIVQTHDGYLWLATFDGLVRFDGVRFTVFNKSNSAGIITNRFVHLYEDAHGDLWATTENSGITQLHQGKFTTYTTENGLPRNTIDGVGDDGFGNLSFASGLDLYRWMDGNFERANDLQLSTGTKPDWQKNQGQPVPFSYMAGYGLTGQVLYSFVNGELRSLATTEFPPGPIFHSPVRDQSGNTWFVFGGGVTKIDNGRMVKTYRINSDLPGRALLIVYGQLPLRVLTIRDDDSLWLTELNSMQSHMVVPRAPEGRDFGPYTVYADHEGNIWIGTLTNGLYRARRQSIVTYGKQEGLTNPEVYPVFEDRDETVWVGGDRLYRLKDGAFISYRNNETGNINSIYQDRGGRLWLNGAWRIENDRIVPAITKDILSQSGAVWSMFEDTGGAYWFGTVSGVVRYQDGVTTRFTTKDGLAGDDTKVIIDDSVGGIWIGSYGGLTHFKEGRFTSWTERDGLPGNTVRVLYQDRDGVLWIGTYDGGLGRFKDGRFTHYSVNDGLYSNGVFQILEDSSGWFWITSNRGIYRVLKQELNDFADGKIKAITSIGYGKSDGMLNAECNGGRWPAGIRARDDKLWFPTMAGVAVIDPGAMTTNLQPPPVVIEGIRINNQPVNMESAIRINPSQDNFEIQYTALSFINSENLHFKYKLEGLDHDWVDAGTRRTAYFSHVPPGEYTFTVIAANSDGVWNEIGKSVKLVVLPPFYRTWWFVALVLVALSLSVWLLFRYRIKQLRARNEQQQRFARQLLASQEDERKRIALELHDSLGQNLLVIKNRALLNSVSAIDEERRIQFTEFSDAVSQSLEEVRSISHNLRPPHLDQLGLRTALVAMIEKVAASSNIEFVITIDELDGIFSPDDEILLYRIVQESLNNILKHSDAMEAEIRLTVAEKQVTLEIHDNGRGISANGDAARRGLGLQSIVERARILNGVPTIHSKPGQGTTIILRIECKTKEVARTT